MDETQEICTVENLRVGDVLLDYGLKMVERGFGYPPNFTGSTDAKGNWIGETPYEITRIRLEDIQTGNAAYIMIKACSLVRCNAEWEVVGTETIPSSVTISKRPPCKYPIPRILHHGIKD